MRDVATIEAEYFAAIVDSSSDPIIGKDLNGLITVWNAAATRVFGYSREEMIGQPILLIIPEDRRQEEAEIIKRLRHGEIIEHFNTVRLRKDGGEIEVSITISPIRDRNGRIVGASKTVRDITKRNRASDLYGRVIEAAPIAVIVSNHTGTITIVNGKSEELLGYKRSELIGKKVELV